jgi:quercetin dioxygenase-like cupin family protein
MPNARSLRRFAVVPFLGATIASYVAWQQPAQHTPYTRSTSGTRVLTSPNGLSIKVLLEAANLGASDVEVAEITFPEAPNAGSHRHRSTEILYVLAGELEHVVNDTTYLLKPGMIGVVRPGDRVAHRVRSSQTVRALAIWAPAGEVAQLASSPAFKQESIPKRD